MDNLGWLSLIPPVLTITLALIFKDVIMALVLGILSGTIMIAGGDPVNALCIFANTAAGKLGDEWNVRIFLFCTLLGGFVALLTHTGAVQSFGNWMASKLRTRRSTLWVSFLFGILIFIDDYFNSLAVGSAMRPVTDRMKVPRAKLAYILDSTAAPVCIIAPISSWVVTVMSYMRDSAGFKNLGVSEFDLFICMIPYNFYALLTLAMVICIVQWSLDFGPMAAAEKYTADTGKRCNEDRYGAAPALEEKEDRACKAKPFDMILPLIVLVATAVTAFPMTTYLKLIAAKKATCLEDAVQSISLRQAFCDTDASYALMYAISAALIFAAVYFILRRLLPVRNLAAALTDGARAMAPALIILVLAWTIGAIIKNPPAENGVGLADFLADVAKAYQVAPEFLPVAFLIFSALIAFATGTSWGTMAIMIPIVMPIIVAVLQSRGLTGMQLVHPVCFTLGATISGAIFGDHASPISDTTILSATGAGCPCLEHVATQFPYALLVILCSGAGYLAGSLCNMSLAVGAVTAVVLFAILLYALSRKVKTFDKTQPNQRRI